MSCQYCGKEIGPIRQLRDPEFCSTKHRSLFQQRLKRGLLRIDEGDEFTPKSLAQFADAYLPHSGVALNWRTAPAIGAAVRSSQSPEFAFAIEPVLGSAPVALAAEAVETAVVAASAARWLDWRLSGLSTLLTVETGSHAFRRSDTLRQLPLPESVTAALDPRGHESWLDFGALTIVPDRLPAAAECEAIEEEAAPAVVPPARENPLTGPQPAAAWAELHCSTVAQTTPQFSLTTPEAPAIRGPKIATAPQGARPVAVAAERPLPLRAALTAFPCEAAEPLSAWPFLLSEPVMPSGSGRIIPLPESEPVGCFLAIRRYDAFVAAHHEPVSPALNFVPGAQVGQASCPAIAAQPVESMPAAAPSVEPVHFAAVAVRLVPLTLEHAGSASLSLSAANAVTADPVEAPFAAAAQIPQSLSATPALLFRPLVLAPAAAAETCAPAAFQSEMPEPLESLPAVRTAVPPPLAAQHLPLLETPGQESGLPQAGLAPVEYDCLLEEVRVHSSLTWRSGKLGITFAKFAVPPAFERLQTAASEQTPGTWAEIVSIASQTRWNSRRAARHLPRAIAASVLLASGLWLGSHTINLSKRVVNRDLSSDVAVNNAPSVSQSPSAAPISSPASWAKSAIARRATVEVTDSFKRGMGAWGVSKGWAPGWSRNSDGYVRPGQLALFQPTVSYKDYRLEFFGEIESRGMGWVVRAQDNRNYYAMKFKVVEPGLRPTLAMVYYPVLGGKAGHKVEVPLSVMVHNNTPYHVAVQVSGKRFTTSIEGQEVESWVDDALPSGGVGFFTEAGERARLYWMRVSKNDDWLGRVCAFLSGNSVEEGQETAWIERGRPPLPPPAPGVPPATDLIVPAGEIMPLNPQGPRSSITRRI